MKYKSLIFTAIAAATGIMSSNQAMACDCWPVSSALEAAKSATLVFEGQALQIKRFTINEIGKDYKEFAVKFRLVDSWKGSLEEQDYVIVRTPELKENCGYQFEVEKTYIVYATGGPVPQVTRCSRTTEHDSSNAKNDLKILNQSYKND